MGLAGCEPLDDPDACAKRDELVMHVYRPTCDVLGCPPSGGAQAAFVVVHGGGYVSGNSCDCFSDTSARHFAERGIVALAIEYRLESERGLAPSTGVFEEGWTNRFANPWQDHPTAMYPAVRDALAAVRFAREALGFECVFVTGHSAGGATALAAGVLSSAHLDGAYYVDEFAGRAPTLDGTRLAASSMVDGAVPVSATIDGIDALLSRDGSDLWRSGRKPPMLLVHGTKDDVNRVENSRWMLENSKFNGSLSAYFVPGAKHGLRGWELLSALDRAVEWLRAEVGLTLFEPHEPTPLSTAAALAIGTGADGYADDTCTEDWVTRHKIHGTRYKAGAYCAKEPWCVKPGFVTSGGQTCVRYEQLVALIASGILVLLGILTTFVVLLRRSGRCRRLDRSQPALEEVQMMRTAVADSFNVSPTSSCREHDSDLDCSGPTTAFV